MQRSSGHRGLSPSPRHSRAGRGIPLRMCQQGWRLSSRRCSVLLLRVGYLPPVVSRGVFNCAVLVIDSLEPATANLVHRPTAGIMKNGWQRINGVKHGQQSSANRTPLCPLHTDCIS